MPTYDFVNNENGEIFEKIMSIDSKTQYLKDNPHIQQLFINAPQINADPLSNNKHRKAFKEVLNNIHQRTSGSALNKTTEL